MAMNEYLNRQLDQISKLISGLKGVDVDLEKLTELDKSLEMLSHRIKTARLEEQEEELDFADQGLKQDAMFYFNQEFEVIRFVGSFENIFGNRKMDSLPGVNSFFSKSKFKEFRQRTELLFKTGEPQSFHSEIISKNGLTLPVHFLLEKILFGKSPNTVSAGMVFSLQTPSELEDYREILIENLPGMDVYLFDTKFRHVLAGGREKERLGLTNADFTGKTLFEVFDEKTQKRLFPFYRNALDGKISEGEVRIKKHVYYIRATPVQGIDFEIVGGALILQDVTKEKEIEKKLVKAKRSAEEADKAKSVFLASMSHEIRTPLNAIIGFTGLLNKTELTTKQKKFSHLIQQSSEHLLSLVNDVLFLFKLEMERVYIEQIPFNPHDLVRNVYESMLFRANESQLYFYYSIESDIPEVLIGDPFRIKQILMNLTGNAIKFTDEGNVSIRVFNERTTAKKVFLRFEVEDTGIGISEDDLSKIFDEFTQSQIENVKKRKGAGLGLTIVRKLIDLLSGRLFVESKPGIGSKFTVVIPFEKTESFIPVQDEKDYGVDFDLLKGKRILYADDDEHNILLGESILKDWEVSFELAYDGNEALEVLRNEKFDIILLDIQMPGFSGVEVVKQVKKDANNPNHQTKMLAVTANIMESDIQEYLNSGFDGYILKPFSEEELYNKICNLLNLEHTKPKKEPVISSGNNEKLKANGFNTSMLMQTAGGDLAFFNQMIDTFTAGAKDASATFRIAVKKENWKEIGKKAHKAIPSFRYFGLVQLVNNLEKLEELILHQKNYGPVKELALHTADEIDKAIRMAENIKIPVDGN
ncbi:MAG: ATP-binding protein [Mariniphaga sp.]|jgi:signal transduction histidine kinase/CheY-like chemotaxis protein|nr:ATP-binding protein [Mariniphaga sp.]